MSCGFQILERDGLSKTGQLKTKHGVVGTPIFFPVHNIGFRSGWNTPRYWDIFPEMSTAMVNAINYVENNRNFQEKIHEKGGIHGLLDFNGVVFIDSGGYKNISSRLNVSQYEVHLAQEKMGADIISSLDFACNYRDDPFWFNKVLKTVQNAEKLNERMDESVLTFASILGNNPSILVNLIKYLEKRCSFDGYAIGSLVPLRSDFRKIVDLLLAVRRVIPDKPIHVYGLGGFQSIPLLTYLGVDSTDSSSFIICASHRRYFIPGFKQVSMHSLSKYNDLPCTCPICFGSSPEVVRGDRNLITLHNLWVIWYEIKQIKYAIRTGSVENYLEYRYSRSPVLNDAFHYAKMKRRKFFE